MNGPNSHEEQHMVTVPGKAANQLRRVRRQAGRRRRRTRRNRFTTMQTTVSYAEEAFWRRLEEREEGRLALEADHLFDTGFTWAV